MDYELGVRQISPAPMRKLKYYGFTATEDEQKDFILVKNLYYTDGEWSHRIFHPDEIEEIYGKEHQDYDGKSGNPFWDYIKKYYGVSVDDTATLILKAISAGDYKSPIEGFIPPVNNLFVRSADGMDYELGVRQTDPKPMRRLEESGYTATAEEKKDFILVKKSNSTEGNWSHTIFYPDEIEEAYKKEHPDYEGNSGNPFWNYIKKYYGVTLKDTATVILKAISTGEYKSPVQ